MKVIGYAEPTSPFVVEAGETVELNVRVKAEEEDLLVTTLVLLGPEDVVVAVGSGAEKHDLVARALSQLSKENDRLRKRVASLEALEEVVAQQAALLESQTP